MDYLSVALLAKSASAKTSNQHHYPADMLYQNDLWASGTVQDAIKKKNCRKKKSQAKKKRRQGRAERRREGKRAVEARASARQQEITIATHNVRTMAVDGTHGVGRALEVLSAYNDLSCDVIGLQETRRAGQTILREVGFVVYCSGESGGDGEKKGQ